MPGYRTLGGAPSGGPVPGTANLRWGPQYGNNERSSFGAVGSIAMGTPKLIVQRDLFVQASLSLLVQINALFSLTSQQALSIIFQLNALFTEIVQGQITMPAAQAAYRALIAQGALGGSVNPGYTLVAQGSITEPAFAEVGLLMVQGAVTGNYQIGGVTLVVGDAIKVANITVGTLSAGNVVASITEPALAISPKVNVVAGLGPVMFPQMAGTLACQTGSLGLTYTLLFEGANTSVTIPNGVTSLRAEAWGGGGAGGVFSTNAGGGGGGAGFARANAFTVASGDVITMTIGAGSVGAGGGTTTIARGATNIARATGGADGGNGSLGGVGAGGAHGVGNVGDVFHSGGDGGAGGAIPPGGGGGGGGAGTLNDGTGGSNTGAAGTGGSASGGNGGIGGTALAGSFPGNPYGGGGGGEGAFAGNRVGAKGAARLTMVA